MSLSGDGASPTSIDRRWRLDGRGARPSSHSRPDPRPTPGRRVVVAIVLAVLALWLGLSLTFRAWQSRYRALADFGATKVAPVVDPLASVVPPDVPVTEWRVAVSDTHAMLLALTGSGVLDETQMDDLRREIASRVAAARPETARRTLAELWDDLERKAGPIIAPDQVKPPANSRHASRNPRPPRPRILGPVNPATRRDPSGSP